MDFGFTQEQQDLRALARKILDDVAPTESLPSFETPHDRHNDALWNELAKAGLLGVGLPEDVGGFGGGITELAILMEELGRSCAPVQALPTLVMAAAPIDRFGSDELRKRILPGVAGGETVLSAALDSHDKDAPSVAAADEGDGVRLNGSVPYVPAATLAAYVLVPAVAGNSLVLALVDPKAPGVKLTVQTTTTGDNEYLMDLSDVSVPGQDVLARDDSATEALEWTTERTLAALCAMELGVADQALRITAKYTAERKQFDKPIAEFQAVAQRAGDAYIDVDAIRLSTQQAVWRLATGQSARRELSIAKFWASEGGHRACYAAQHLHGGIGVDTDYPLHHYYLLSRRIEVTLGGANSHLAWLGGRLAGDSWQPAG